MIRWPGEFRPARGRGWWRGPGGGTPWARRPGPPAGVMCRCRCRCRCRCSTCWPRVPACCMMSSRCAGSLKSSRVRQSSRITCGASDSKAARSTESRVVMSASLPNLAMACWPGTARSRRGRWARWSLATSHSYQVSPLPAARSTAASSPANSSALQVSSGKAA